MYDVIVVGGGHAGCEASLATSRKGHKTLLVTGNIKNIADMPCNPSISNLFNLEELNNQDLTYLSSARSISLLNQSLIKLNEIKEALNNNLPVDFIELDLRNIWNLLGEIIGVTYTDELIDNLFSKFCLGK